MSSWGVELWDEVDCVIREVTMQTEELGQVCAKLIKERGEVEREYAKNLRKLIARFSTKEEKKNELQVSSRNGGLRLILAEVGYQAGQHELLSEAFNKKIPHDIKQQVKETQKQLDNHKMNLKTHQTKLDKTYKSLNRSKAKYIKQQLELESSSEALKRAEAEGMSSQADIEKLRQITTARERQAEEYKGDYAVDLVKTNQRQAEYFHSELPAALGSLQSISKENCEYFKRIWSNCVQVEKEVAFIIGKCHEEMENVIHNINPEEDSEAMIEKYKTGNLPPPDLLFDDMSSGPGPDLVGTVGRSRERKASKQVEERETCNLYQKKRELERKIQALEMQIEKGLKDEAALQLMVKTYTANPQFGDVGQFCGELERASQLVEVSQSGVQLLAAELSGVSNRLELIRRPDSQALSTPEYRRRDTDSPAESVGSSVQSTSVGQDSGVRCSSASDKDYESVDGEDEEDNDDAKKPCVEDQKIKNFNLVNNDSELLKIYTSGFYGWMNICEDFPSTPPPLTPPPTNSLGRVVALYPFVGESASNIPMAEGEQFEVVESDQEGWTRVRRVDGRFFPLGEEEGFVPTSFFRFID